MIMCLAFLNLQIKMLSPRTSIAPRIFSSRADPCLGSQQSAERTRVFQACGVWIPPASDFRRRTCSLELVLSASLRSSCWFFLLWMHAPWLVGISTRACAYAFILEACLTSGWTDWCCSLVLCNPFVHFSS